MARKWYHKHMNKGVVMIGATVGSTLGGAIPMLWHDSFFSPWSVLLSGVGGLAGIYGIYKLYN